jgi:hypothetical protein
MALVRHHGQRMFEMPDPAAENTTSTELTRRRLVQIGAAGAATFLIGSRGGFEGVAQAATSSNGLRRSDYLGLSSSGFTASVDGGSRALELVGVEDLPIASQVPSLANSDDAFSLIFEGSGPSFPQGVRELSHPQLGKLSLFVVPVGRRTGDQTYEVIVDRTVKIPGLEEGGGPQQVNPGARAEMASPRKVAAAGIGPSLRRASLRPSTSGKRLLADVQLANAASVVSVRATLLRRGRVVAIASAGSSRGRSLLRFGARAPLNPASYQLSLVMLDRAGRATALRKAVRFTP